ncbi:MAG: response regulator [Bacteroidetes bacterium]|nr:response regulator [Bacteroidota bacterium]
MMLLVSLCGVTISHAQNEQVSKDSLSILWGQTNTHFYNYNYKEAIESSALLLQLAERQGDSLYVTRAYSDLGQIHYAIKDTIKAKHYYEKCLEHAILIQNDPLIIAAYNDIGNVVAENEANFEKSIWYYEKAIEVNVVSGNGEEENLVQFMNIGWTYLDAKQHEKAIEYLRKAKKYSLLKKQHPLLDLNLDILFGRYYYYANLNGLATKTLKETAERATSENYMDQASESYEYLAKVYEQTGQMRMAIASLRKQHEFDAKIHDTEREAQMVEVSAKFAVEEYQKNLDSALQQQILGDALIEKSRQLTSIFIISSIVCLVGFFAILLLFRGRKKFVNKLYENNLELTRAKNKAERLSRLKTRFFSTVSHELRTPLYGVIGLSSILMEDEQLSSHKEDLKSLKFSADYLLALINDVLMLNRMDANGIQLEKTPFKLIQLAESIKHSFAFSLQQNHNRLHLSIDERLPEYFQSDSVRLSQVLMNLVGNAVKFNENGNIWIDITLEEESENGIFKTKFAIKDDGIGIPPEKQKIIFEEFSQVQNKNYNYQGTGLGLTIVRKLLHLFGSEIKLHSEIGKGSTFSFSLLLEEATLTTGLEELSASDQEELINIVRRENLHILVVDDNRINQKITQKILETRNFKCNLASDGIEAIELASAYNYDLILMDIHMPNMSGIEATKQIRKFNTNTPIVALTAVEVAEIRKTILDAGMNDIILKPYDVSQFLNTILRNLNKVVEVEEIKS